MITLRDEDGPYPRALLYPQVRRALERAELWSPEIEEILMTSGRYPSGRRRSREAREAALGVVEGFRRGFEDSLNLRFDMLESRLGELGREQDQVHAILEEQEKGSREIRTDIGSLLWLASVGADLGAAELSRYVPIRLYLADPLPSAAVVESISSSLQRLIESVGLEKAHELPAESGSFWQRIFFKTKQAVTQEEVRDQLAKAGRAIEIATLDKPQAEANKLQAEAASALIASLGGSSAACVQAGSLLVVKSTSPNGEAQIAVRTLSAMQLKRLEERQSILREPDQILEWLDSGTEAKLLGEVEA